MANVLDDIATRFMAFSDALEASISDINIDFSLPSRTGPTGKAAKATAAAAAAGDAKAREAAAAERAAAKKRGEEILAQLPASYFDKSFDALEHELRQMGPDARQDDIDTVVDRLTSAMEVVSMQLAQHVLQNQDKLIAGITNVTLVEDDLKAAHVICQGTRAQLRVASDEVQRQIKIITCTRKKQHCLELYEALSKMKKVQDLPAALRKVHEEADYAEGILQCVDCFRVVEELSQFEVAPALQLSVQRCYYDTMQRMTAALQNVCADFNGDGYSRLLEAYLLQGVPGDALADKVLSCFKGLLQEMCMRLVRSMVLARLAFSGQQPGDADKQGGFGSSSQQSNGGSDSAGSYSDVLEECSFAELCRRVPPDMLAAVMSKMLEAAFDLLVSYSSMEAWQEAGLAQHSQAAAAAAAAAALAAAHSLNPSQDGAGNCVPEAGSTCETLTAPSKQQLDHVQAATKGMLSAVHAALVSNKVSIAELAAVHLKDLMVGAGGCAGADFYKVTESCLQFAAMAEAFVGGVLPMRAAYLHVLGAFVPGSHKSNMQALKHALATETWVTWPAELSAAAACSQQPGADGQSRPTALTAPDTGSITQSLSCSGCRVPAFGEDGFVNNFGVWVKQGNPFRAKGRAVGGAAPVSTAAGTAIQPAATPAPTSSNAAASIASTPASRPIVAARSSLLVLRWLVDYAGLAVMLPGHARALWGGMAELFDNYLLACFVLFGGVSLETLVWQEGCLPHRLRAVLLRITTSPNCKYKAEVEQLLRTKPAAPQAQAGPASSGNPGQFMGFGGGAGVAATSSAAAGGTGGAGRKLDAFTRAFKHTVVELINTDLSQPLPDYATSSSSSSSSPAHLTPRPMTPVQQQQQAQAAPKTLQTVQQQQQQQQPGQPKQEGADPADRAPPAPAAAPTPVTQAGGPTQASPIPGSTSTEHSGSPGQQQSVQARLLQQRVAAIHSLALLADALRAAKPALLQHLAAAGLSKEVEAYYARTVDAAADLREAIYMGGARQLLAVLADDEYGLAVQVAACNYAMREPATRYQPWVEVMVQQYGAFGRAMASSGLTPEVQLKVWEAAVRVGSEALLDGFSGVRRCTQEGRAAMSLDMSAVDKGLRAVAPPSALAPLRLVTNYIQAFYLPWDELGRWAQTHSAEYGRGRILVLAEVMADAYGVRRGQKAALMERLSAELTEFV